ncbi:MAG: polysaccharide deacetylase family protein [Armatimonadetes bacterium]|nr:polysaccharide deacetylase family protein [Armatimonadota bacterium]
MSRPLPQRTGAAVRVAAACIKRSGVSVAPVILMYHRIVRRDTLPHLPEPGMWVDASTFDRQLDLLKRTREIVPLYRIADAVRNGEGLPPRACAVTFDDGWLDNYTNAFPLLIKHNIPATIFLTSGFVGAEMPFWTAEVWDSLHALTPDPTPPDWFTPDMAGIVRALARAGHPPSEHLISRCMGHIKTLPATLRIRTADYLMKSAGWRSDERRAMNWDEAREMYDAGIEFGIHTRTHPVLSELTRDEIDREIIGSKLETESNLGIRVTALAYPYGDFDQRARLAAIDAGLELACTTTPGSCAATRDPYTLPRVGVHEGMSEGFSHFSSLAFATRLNV